MSKFGVVAAVKKCISAGDNDYDLHFDSLEGQLAALGNCYEQTAVSSQARRDSDIMEIEVYNKRGGWLVATNGGK